MRRRSSRQSTPNREPGVGFPRLPRDVRAFAFPPNHCCHFEVRAIVDCSEVCFEAIAADKRMSHVLAVEVPERRAKTKALDASKCSTNAGQATDQDFRRDRAAGGRDEPTNTLPCGRGVIAPGAIESSRAASSRTPRFGGHVQARSTCDRTPTGRLQHVLAEPASSKRNCPRSQAVIKTLT